MIIGDLTWWEPIWKEVLTSWITWGVIGLSIIVCVAIKRYWRRLWTWLFQKDEPAEPSPDVEMGPAEPPPEVEITFTPQDAHWRRQQEDPRDHPRSNERHIVIEHDYEHGPVKIKRFGDIEFDILPDPENSTDSRPTCLEVVDPYWREDNRAMRRRTEPNALIWIIRKGRMSFRVKIKEGQKEAWDKETNGMDKEKDPIPCLVCIKFKYKCGIRKGEVCEKLKFKIHRDANGPV